MEELVFGTQWDTPVKVSVKAGSLPADALHHQGPLAEELSALAAQHKAEQAEALAEATTGAEPRQAAAEHQDADLTVDSVQANGTCDRVEIRLNTLPDDRREIIKATL